MQAQNKAQIFSFEPLEIVIIDNDQFYKESLKSIANSFLPQGSRLQTANCYEQAYELLSTRNNFKQCILLDLHLEQDSAIEILHRVKVEFPELTIIIMADDACVETALTCLQNGAEDYLDKRGVTSDTLKRTIYYAVGRASGRLETQRLKQELQAEKRMNTMHRSFINLVNHEFRTPLAIIYSAAQWMRQSGECDAPLITKRLDKIDRAVRRLENLMNNVAMLDRLEEGHVKCQPCDISMHVLMAEILQDFDDITPGSRISLDLTRLPNIITIDKELFTHVIQNIISNALKYSDEHSRVEVWGFGRAGSIHLFFRDYGLGIPTEDFEHIGQKFYRSSVTNHIPGTGLGLFLVQQFLEYLGGHMFISSELGVGTTIKLHIPAAT